MDTLKLSKEQQSKAISDIKEYFLNERDETLGDLGAGLILDFILEKIGPHIYNQAITDAQKYMADRVEDMYSLLI